MKHVLPYALFEASATAPQALTQEQIEWLDECVDGSWKLNPQTGFVDVDGHFDCSGQDLEDLKGVRFGKVNGGFYCNDNLLTSLVGAPHKVDGNFYCKHNDLTSLVGAPKTVGGSFVCYNNGLTSLEGAPQSVGGDFDCRNNNLTSLEGAPQTVGGRFGCSDNQLTTLEGAPQTVGGGFYCKNNQLTTLEGAPLKVGGFNCSENRLTSLEGAPQTVGGAFNCADNSVSETTLKGIFALMRKGMAYQQALKQFWPKMEDKDRVLMYKQMTNLPPEEVRKYKALATYNNIKNYL